MTTIYYTLGPNSGSIIWAASEAFDELRGKTYHLGHMEATAIVQLKDLSTTAKILLSAVAGALIQHLLDQGYPPTKSSKPAVSKLNKPLQTKNKPKTTQKPITFCLYW